jgi:ribosome-associated protein
MVLSEAKKEKLLTEVQVSASRSGGPGGQNVNKVSTKIEIRFSVQASEALNEAEKQLLSHKAKNRINLEGELIITSATERSQWRNREKAEKKFLDIIEKALTVPRRRKQTKPTAASRQKRIETKKQTAQKKELRKPPQF